MEELKHHQPSMTIDEQINNLKSLGLIINDDIYARKILNDISYFRLIKAYSLNLKVKNGRYKDNIKFEQLVEFSYIFFVQIRLQSTIAYAFFQFFCQFSYLSLSLIRIVFPDHINCNISYSCCQKCK